MTSAHFSWEMNSPLAVDGKSLSRLADVIAANVGPVEVEARCADLIHRKFPDMQHLLAYDNFTKRRLVSVTLEAASQSRTRVVNLKFDSRGYQTANVIVRGEDEFVTPFSDDMRDMIQGLRPWFWWIRKVDLVVLVAMIIAALMVTVGGLVAFGVINGSDGTTSKASFPVQGYFYLAIGIGIIALINSLRSFFFPMLTFAVGQQEAREAVRDKARWVLVVSPVVAGLIRWLTA